MLVYFADAIFDGTPGADSLAGSAGNDTLRGFDGNDTLFGNPGVNVLDGGKGIDTVTFNGYTANLDLTLSGKSQFVAAGEWDTLIGIENLVGGSGNDLLRGSKVPNWLEGGAGNDTIYSAGGGDTLVGGAGDDVFCVTQGDVIVEAANGGFDLVHAMKSWTLADNVEAITLMSRSRADATGNTLANVLQGNEGTNKLSGLGGDDTLDGGLGRDTLVGGSGADVFRFSSTLSKSNFDSISDFDSAVDGIALDHSIFTALAVGALSAAAFQSGAAAVAATAQVRIIFDTADGALLYDRDGAGGVAAVKFAVVTLVGGPLSEADFHIS